MKLSSTAWYVVSVCVLTLVLVFAALSGSMNRIVQGGIDPVHVTLIVLVGAAVLGFQARLVLGSLVGKLQRAHMRTENLEREISQLQTIDPLTKAYSRFMLEDVLTREVECIRRYEAPVSGIMFDVDNMKDVNNILGYREGDLVLKDLADTIRRHIRKSDYLFRWSGGRFVILSPYINAENAGVLAEKIRLLVERKKFKDCKVTVSLGVAQIYADDTPEVFLERIKTALQTAKLNGKNTLTILNAA